MPYSVSCIQIPYSLAVFSSHVQIPYSASRFSSCIPILLCVVLCAGSPILFGRLHTPKENHNSTIFSYFHPYIERRSPQDGRTQITALTTSARLIEPPFYTEERSASWHAPVHTMCIIQMVRPDKFVLKLPGILKGRRQRRSPLAYPFDSIRSIVLELLDRCADRCPD